MALFSTDTLDRYLEQTATLAAETAQDADTGTDSPWQIIDPQELIFKLTGRKIDIAEEQDEDIISILNTFEDTFEDYLEDN